MFCLPLIYFLNGAVGILGNGFNKFACCLFEFLEAQVDHWLLRVQYRPQVDWTECRDIRGHITREVEALVV